MGSQEGCFAFCVLRVRKCEDVQPRAPSSLEDVGVVSMGCLDKQGNK